MQLRRRILLRVGIAAGSRSETVRSPTIGRTLAIAAIAAFFAPRRALMPTEERDVAPKWIESKQSVSAEKLEDTSQPMS